MWWTLGFNTVIYLAGLQDISREYYDAAKTDGANAWQSSGNPIVMAGGIIASIPVLILFLLAQRYVVEGVARSGLK